MGNKDSFDGTRENTQNTFYCWAYSKVNHIFPLEEGFQKTIESSNRYIVNSQVHVGKDAQVTKTDRSQTQLSVQVSRKGSQWTINDQCKKRCLGDLDQGFLRSCATREVLPGEVTVTGTPEEMACVGCGGYCTPDRRGSCGGPGVGESLC